MLEAVADGRVIRGKGGETSIFAPHLLDGEPVFSTLYRLAQDDLVDKPISGPPRLAPRGEYLLAIARGEPPDG